MQTTKRRILALLKRHGRGTVETLAAELVLAPMTVRQHLSALERDALVSVREERQAKGRPHFVYGLTGKGDETFPKRYDRLASQVLAEVGCLDVTELVGLAPSERTALIVRRIADRTVARYAPRLEGCQLVERVQGLGAILQEESGFAEWTPTEDGFEIRDYNCVYRGLGTDDPLLCYWHQRVIGALVGMPVHRAPLVDAGGSCCRFIIAIDAPGGRNGAGRLEEEARYHRANEPEKG